jgi:FdhD protein
MGYAPYRGIKISGNHGSPVEDELTLESPLSISINGNAFSITMQTPGDEEDLVIGLLNGEGILKRNEGIPELKVIERFDGGSIKTLDVQISKDLVESRINSRNLLSVASCGICGQKEWKEALGKDQPLSVKTTISGIEIEKMFIEMERKQSTFLKSGGSHAAAIFDSKFKLMAIREDVGRHNAVDKSVGALIRKNQIDNAEFLLVSGRVSYEIIVKCFKARIPFLAAVSAPSSLAVDYAEELGITLLAFCRGESATAYSRVTRLLVMED